MIRVIYGLDEQQTQVAEYRAAMVRIDNQGALLVFDEGTGQVSGMRAVYSARYWRMFERVDETP